MWLVLLASHDQHLDLDRQLIAGPPNLDSTMKSFSDAKARIARSDAIELDEDRVENLRRAIVECIADFQRKHHDDKVSVIVAEQEILKAIADVLGYYVAAIEEGKDI